MSETVLNAEEITVRFHTGHGRTATTINALNAVSLRVERGEVMGLVGESGSGKSTMARVICGLQPYSSGTLEFDSRPLGVHRSKSDRRSIQMVFQDPYASLDPRMTVAQTIGEVLRVHEVVPRDEIRKRSEELMELVQLPVSILDSRPAGMSGGQRQRIAIARALAVNPELLVADEAVSALDVSVQAGIVNLLSDLRTDLGLSILFIAHDLAVVRSLCDRVAVIYHGDLVEERVGLELFSDPHNEYTKQLLAAVPRVDGVRAEALDAGSLRRR